jgi:hypothetical protein
MNATQEGAAATNRRMSMQDPRAAKLTLEEKACSAYVSQAVRQAANKAHHAQQAEAKAKRALDAALSAYANACALSALALDKLERAESAEGALP